jgi:digeranylgeranylglycerophospholipid reductase
MQNIKKSLIRNALSNGAEVRFKTRVDSVIKEKSKVTGVKVKNQKIKGKVVIGADGSSSIIAKTAGFDLSSYKTLPSFRFKYKNAKIQNPDEALFLIGRDIGLGYLWAYPQSKTKTNVGIGAIGNKNMTKFFNNYVSGMNELKNAKVYARGGDTIPYSGVLPTIAKGGVALVGDAAGQVDPLVGGGVRPSVNAADFLAPYVINSMENHNYLLNYDKDYHSSKDCKIINRAATTISRLERAHKKTDLFALLAEIQKTIPSKILKKASMGELSKADIASYALRNPMLALKILRTIR